MPVPTADNNEVARWAGATDDPAVDPRVAALGGGALTIVSAAVAIWSALIDAGAVSALPVVAAAAACLCGFALLGLPRVRTAVAFHVAAALAAACITSAVATSDPGAAAAPVFYVPVVLYAAYFLTRASTFVLAIVVAAAFAAVAFVQGFDAAAPRAALLAVTLFATAALVRLLRDRAFALIAALHDVSRTDALTGVMNRLGLEEKLTEELERAARSGVDCAVLIGDLDRFKALNDRLGHHAGDAALRRTAKILRDRLRRLDRVGRYGGDEFVVILPATDRASADHVVRELEGAVMESSFESGCVLRMSFGAAVFPHDGLSLDEILQAADRALLAAKAAGQRLAADTRY